MPRQRKPRKTLPLWVALRIRDAGASAYAWADSEFLDLVDPSQRITRASTAVTAAAVVGHCVLVVALGFTIGTGSGLSVLLISLAGLVWRRAQRWSSIGLATVVVALWPVTNEPLALISLAAAACLAVFVHLRQPRSRGIALSASTASLFLGAAALRDWVPAVLLLAVLANFVAAGIIRPSISNDLPFHRPGPPPSTLPWLVQVLKRHDLANLPDTIRRKTLGAEGERSTAMRLLGLQGRRILGIPLRARAIAVHDIASLDPTKDRANLDHLVLTESGVYVLDTKVFASGSGVTAQPSDIAVQAASGAPKSIMPLIAALARECVATRRALNSPAMGLLVVHGARIPRGLSVYFHEESVTVEILDQKDLIARLTPDRSSVLSRKEYRELASAIRRIPSASGGVSTPVRPLTLRYAKRSSLPAPASPTVTLASVAALAARPASQASRVSTIHAMWDEMLRSVPAPPDLVDEDLRSLSRGSLFEVFSIQGDVSSKQMHAVTGPCATPGGPLFIWATDAPNWSAFHASGKPVAITRIPLDKIINSHAPSK